MTNHARTVAIASALLAGLSIILLFVSIPFQKMYAASVLEFNSKLLEILPQIPIYHLIYAILFTACTGLVILCCNSKEKSIAPEVVLLICMAFILPMLNKIISPQYAVIMARMGNEYIAAHSIISNMATYMFIPLDVGLVLSYVACGMSIAGKIKEKEPVVYTSEN